MLFNFALFSSLLLVPAVLAVPSALGARIARRREGRQSQLNSRIEQTAGVVSNTQYSENWAGAVWAEGNVRSVFHGLFCNRHRSRVYITGNFYICHRDLHRPHPIWFGRGFCRRLGWHRR